MSLASLIPYSISGRLGYNWMGSNIAALMLCTDDTHAEHRRRDECSTLGCPNGLTRHGKAYWGGSTLSYRPVTIATGINTLGEFGLCNTESPAFSPIAKSRFSTMT